MKLNKTKNAIQSDTAHVQRWILPTQKDAGLNLLALSATAFTVTFFVALFAAPL